MKSLTFVALITLCAGTNIAFAQPRSTDKMFICELSDPETFSKMLDYQRFGGYGFCLSQAKSTSASNIEMAPLVTEGDLNEDFLYWKPSVKNAVVFSPDETGQTQNDNLKVEKYGLNLSSKSVFSRIPAERDDKGQFTFVSPCNSIAYVGEVHLSRSEIVGKRLVSPMPDLGKRDFNGREYYYIPLHANSRE